MNRTWIVRGLILLVLLGCAGGAIAQWGRGRRRDIRPETADRKGLPIWENNSQFTADLFTFVRVRYSSYGGRGWEKWATDWPDSDLNFSFRLQQLTALKVDPQGKIYELTDEAIFDFPFLYLIEPGNLLFSDEEVLALRRYLTNGGFLMVDDFWGEDEWENFRREIKRVFPNQEPQELPLEHEIFHCVYDLKSKPMIPSIHAWEAGQTTERWDAHEAHFKALFDDKQRMVVLICHNTDLGDGWEQEGVNPNYFRDYSEKWAYPLGINIVTYAMTH
ncbi:MAG: DUF4159 domain-containing protein [Planctomycetota bacterium]|nr:DUF4159 domain-containing protein [Planctomycetota bacterium]